MKKTAPLDPRLADFPAVLRKLLDAELAVGNHIAEIASCFPAPPAGAYVKLAKPITTRPRAKTPQLDFYDRNSSLYSGEWTDAKRFYFILEPPRPPEPVPDMNAIRDARNAAAAQSQPSDWEMLKPDARPPEEPAVVQRETKSTAGPGSVLERFKASMRIDYYKWHDGEGYDVGLIKKASPAERKAIEEILLKRSDEDWRDIEALAALKTPKAKAALAAAFEKGDAEIRGAVLRHAPELVSKAKKTASLVKALKTAVIYGGLTEALDEIEEFHPPEVIDALFRGVLAREGDVAVHFAAMVMFLHGKAREAFDWNHRPFFLKFNTADRAARDQLFRELCAKVGVKPEKYLRRR